MLDRRGGCAFEEAEAVGQGREGRPVLRQDGGKISRRAASDGDDGRAKSGVGLFAAEYPLMARGEFERALGNGG